ncbi:beta-ketoacyl-ACP synthase II [Leptolyngbya sp. FACHB-261]|uniref:beta-ketoacyl-ACP synthase II n=1 Tax=Leptolyngbya sp. FACHB-261 TaxID=2692806 RepID=UPI001686FA27|nr:beta-ketoacyl-ACP synthase II [Leptolyngbya sp. FACHB-261]MBD2100548.1 beta-ketoacyl-ACP synthase II [Leptolyngbya sp. FACHB-261]
MAKLERKRVVVTGVGAITPLGNTSAEFWAGLMASRSGVGPITQFDTARYACRIAAEVKGFNPLDFMTAKQAKRMDRCAHFAIAASKQALTDANFEINELNAEQVGVVIGTGIGGLKSLEDQHRVYLSQGPERCSPFMIPMMLANMASGLTAIQVGAKGPNSCPVTACATGANAIGDALRFIQQGFAQAMLCGGTEAAITPLTVAGFAAARGLSIRNDQPEQASRPFDRDRDGFVLGEGAGVLLVEDLDSALNRGARIYAEVVGYGLTCDAYHMTAPNPSGVEMARAMQLALKDAHLQPEQVNYINAHATSTPTGDPIETLAIKKALGEHAYQVAISSTKSMTGHLLGAAGGIEAVATVLAITNNRIPPTINLTNLDADCDLDYVPNLSREQTIQVALSNSFGFGGHNATLAFGKWNY